MGVCGDRSPQEHQTAPASPGLTEDEELGQQRFPLELQVTHCLECNFYQLSKIPISASNALKTCAFQLGTEQT